MNCNICEHFIENLTSRQLVCSHPEWGVDQGAVIEEMKDDIAPDWCPLRPPKIESVSMTTKGVVYVELAYRMAGIEKFSDKTPDEKKTVLSFMGKALKIMDEHWTDEYNSMQKDDAINKLMEKAGLKNEL